jgi:hypothetical protein
VVRYFDKTENAGGNKGTPRSGMTLLEKDGLTKIGPSELLVLRSLSDEIEARIKMNAGIFPTRLNFDPPLGFVWVLAAEA